MATSGPAQALAQAASGVDCQATNFQPPGVFAQPLRNKSFRLRGWPPISASIMARPVMSATSPITRTLRSVQLTLLYLVLPDCIDASQLVLVSVTPEECVYSRSPCSIASSALKSRAIIAPKRLSSSARISFAFIALPPLSLFHFDVSSLDDRPPFRDLGFLKPVERLRRLLVARKNLLPQIGQLCPNLRIGQGAHDRGIELGDDTLRRAFGHPKPMPQRGMEAGQPRLVHRRGGRRRGQSGVGGERIHLDRTAAHILY